MKKILLSVSFSVLLAVMNSSAAEQMTFRNSSLGITLTKASAWQIIHTGDYLNDLTEVNLESTEVQEQIKKNANVPLFAFAKYLEPYEGINSTFKVHFKYRNALPDFAQKNASEILTITLNAFKHVFKDFKIIEGPIEVDVGGIKSAYVQYNCTLTRGVTAFPTSSEIWVIPRGDYFYLIMSVHPQDNIEDLAEITQMITSINLVY